VTFGTDGLSDGQFKNASAIAVGKDGSIYVGDGTLRIQKFDSSGKFVKLWNVTESKTKTNDQYTNKITNLAIDSKNTLYAVVERKELLRYDANTGKFIDKVELYGEKWMNQQQAASVLDMFMLNDDNLAIFATSFPEGEYVMNVSPDGKSEIKHKDLLKKQGNDTATRIGGGILVSVTGDIFLLRGSVGLDKPYLYRFKSDGSYVDRFTWEGGPSNGFLGNSFLALNSKGEIYAFNKGKKQIDVLNVEGVLQRTISLDAEYFEKMIVDQGDNIYVLSRTKVEKFSPTGSALGSE
jgi:outer membrane protein assembly factor BamB